MDEFTIVYDETKKSLAESLRRLMRVKAAPLQYSMDERGVPDIDIDVGFATRFVYLGGFLPPYADSFIRTATALATLSERGIIELAMLSPLPYHKGSNPRDMVGFATIARSLWHAKRFATFDVIPIEKLSFFKSQVMSLSAFPTLVDYVGQKWGKVDVLAVDEELSTIAEALALRVGGGVKKLAVDVETLRFPKVEAELFFSTHLLDTSPFSSFEEVITTNLVNTQPHTKVLDVAPVLMEYIKSL